MTYDRMLSEDIVQNVYLKLFESMDKIESASSVEFWLFTTARNEIYHYYRNKKIHSDKYDYTNLEDVDITSDESIEDIVEKADIRDHLDEQLRFMPMEQKEVFLLKEFGGYSYKEISTILNIDAELVKSRLHKVRKKIINRISRLIN